SVKGVIDQIVGYQRGRVGGESDQENLVAAAVCQAVVPPADQTPSTRRQREALEQGERVLTVDQQLVAAQEIGAVGRTVGHDRRGEARSGVSADQLRWAGGRLGVNDPAVGRIDPAGVKFDGYVEGADQAACYVLDGHP